jgi:hypothetical protein
VAGGLEGQTHGALMLGFRHAVASSGHFFELGPVENSNSARRCRHDANVLKHVRPIEVAEVTLA